jgi:hypothetical protein
MKPLFSGACLAAICAATLSAQGTTAQTGTTDRKAETLTVTGCLRAGSEPNSFVLSDLEWPDTPTPTGTSGTRTGTSGAPPAAASAVTLRLVDGPGLRLSEHVGHKVEITGTLIDEVKPTAGPAAIEAARTGTGGDQTSRRGEAKPQETPEQTINVRTVKMIADQCS